MRGNVRRLKSSDKLKKQRVSKLKRMSGCALKRKRGDGRRRKRHRSAPVKRPHVCVLKMSNGSAKSVRVSQRRRRRSVSVRRVSRESEKQRLRVVRRVSRRSNRRHLILTQRSQCRRAPSRSRLRRAQRGTKSRRLSGSRDGDLQGRANRLRGSTRRSIVPGLRWMATHRRKRASRRC